MYTLWSSSLFSLLQSPASSSFLDPNILLSILFSDTVNLCSSLAGTDQVSHPYKTAGIIIVLCISVFTFLERRWGNKRFWTWDSVQWRAVSLVTAWFDVTCEVRTSLYGIETQLECVPILLGYVWFPVLTSSVSALPVHSWFCQDNAVTLTNCMQKGPSG
jgi:hypothetical protein